METVKYMDEFSFINQIKQDFYKQPSLLKGIGDDAAVLRETTNDMVVAVDTFVEGIHFTKETMAAFYVGYRALAANFSDMAAMGAVPTYYLVSLVVPNSWDGEALTAIFTGMKKLAYDYGVDLIGGDTVSGETLVLSVTVMGRVEKNKARYRSIAKENDIVFVTGTLGDSQAGLHLLQHTLNHENKDYFIRRHRMPQPRIHFAKGISDLKRVALNDISDGLASEAHEIADTSEVSLVLRDEAIPVYPGYNQFSAEDQARWKYFGGEDFELLGTVPKKDWPFVQQVARQMKLKVTEIGYVTNRQKQPVYLEKDNRCMELKKAGYMHMK